MYGIFDLKTNFVQELVSEQSGAWRYTKTTHLTLAQHCHRAFHLWCHKLDSFLFWSRWMGFILDKRWCDVRPSIISPAIHQNKMGYEDLIMIAAHLLFVTSWTGTRMRYEVHWRQLWPVSHYPIDVTLFSIRDMNLTAVRFGDGWAPPLIGDCDISSSVISPIMHQIKSRWTTRISFLLLTHQICDIMDEDWIDSDGLVWGEALFTFASCTPYWIMLHLLSLVCVVFFWKLFTLHYDSQASVGLFWWQCLKEKESHLHGNEIIW